MTLKLSTKKWKENVVEDALSRKEEDIETLICAIHSIRLLVERNEDKMVV
jgi:hypothetical protein